MKKIFFAALICCFAPFAVAQVPPPVCDEPFEYVRSYGQWSLQKGIWSLPFVCATGYEGIVNINRENVGNTGLAEYYIQAEGVENDNTFFFVDPCNAMGSFCRFLYFGRQSGTEPVLNLQD